MTAFDLEDFLTTAITDYAKEKVEAGTWDEEESLAKSQDSFNKLLYDGITTPNEYLYSIISGEKIGYIWFHVDETRSGKHAFIYDFVIFEAFRGKGFGTKTLAALDVLAKEMQITKIELHVFAHNQTAIDLYNKVGFQNTDITMAKYL
ncbi:GNAT family N-acetyltransferase [Listeria monocytogenes]|uniref:GNAT family N-acetyltransferase n=1 Tax=Listeria monocytogenes TaxID=1639 RepID=UPI0011EB5AB2|nr:GNAT family N-acetyltransferase [Listeria monocytogenes]EHC5256256.1 GNAT family N-acetyltransferase [Listeria monocytogenes serotype 1/2a]ECL4451974.1 GNAT family N-acetyltransferase [Listeria monocytogenes]EKZ4543062.1 GNAT family N-acetyltransferase [Listeria monocytogenes]ELK7956726.1 GNAT family N-acetyltransferase [Listeria monocytogenes]ELK8001677.1 GNAT family N-acetyltransferase [Listeria monocytogenes]